MKSFLIKQSKSKYFTPIFFLNRKIEDINLKEIKISIQNFKIVSYKVVHFIK